MPSASKEREELQAKWYASAEIAERERQKLEGTMRTLNADEQQQIQMVLLTSCEGKPPIKCERGARYFVEDGVVTCR
jgi:hypothetical protein